MTESSSTHRINEKDYEDALEEESKKYESVSKHEKQSNSITDSIQSFFYIPTLSERKKREGEHSGYKSHKEAVKPKGFMNTYVKTFRDLEFYDFYIYFLVITKLISILISFWYFYLLLKSSNTTNSFNETVNWVRLICEFIFIAMAAGLLIYLFIPLRWNLEHRLKRMHELETEFVLCSLGAILFISNKWEHLVPH